MATLPELWAQNALEKTPLGRIATNGRWTKEFLRRAEAFAASHFETYGKYPRHEEFKIPTATQLYAARALQDDRKS